MNRDIPKLYQAGYERALSGKASPRGAIKAFCAECVGYERREITCCTDTGCPLYRYQPYQERFKRPPESCQTPNFGGGSTAESKKSVQGYIG